MLEDGVVIGRIFKSPGAPQDRQWMWATGHNGDIRKVDTWAEGGSVAARTGTSAFPESDFAKGRAPAVDRVVKEMARPRPITKTDK